MALRPFGPTGVSVPKIGLGTWMIDEDDQKSALAALERGLELGLSHLDTAELYGSGSAEDLVARVIKGRRERVFLVSKVLPTHASRQGTLRACEQSLRRLGTDYLDAYLLHWPGSHPLSGTLEAFQELRAKGRIRAFGVSNFDVPGLEQALALVGPGQLACNQVLYHLAERTIEHEVLPWCEAHGVAVVGYTPFGRSAFPPPAGRDVLEGLARARGLGPRALALAFLTRRPGLFAIPKSSNPRHVEENAKALDLELGPAEIEAIDRAFPVGRRRRGVASL